MISAGLSCVCALNGDRSSVALKQETTKHTHTQTHLMCAELHSTQLKANNARVTHILTAIASTGKKRTHLYAILRNTKHHTRKR